METIKGKGITPGFIQAASIGAPFKLSAGSGRANLPSIQAQSPPEKPTKSSPNRRFAILLAITFLNLKFSKSAWGFVAAILDAITLTGSATTDLDPA
ncbi:hypothetical protein [Burkholderia vietnamiensis]|uniref:hypothetical protein n=1 Tax=Burkholderia vietnamiensis TaxID=60552 RepID=UPI0012D8B685|nr:hypothetical protein [Burkholderia vietnamiensis]